MAILIVVPSVPKLIRSQSNILFRTHFTRKQVNEAFAATVKMIVYYKYLFGETTVESFIFFNIIASKTTSTITFRATYVSFLGV